ncbi:MAG TPA: chromosomal replication initiator protein DnaA [Candidatus Nanoarchaeia archaeon]
MDEKTLWNSVLTELQLLLSGANYQTWFKGKTVILHQERGVIEIGCNSAYTKDWLEQRYHGQLKAILDRLTDTNNALIFSVSASLRNPPTKVTQNDSGEEALLFTNQSIDELYGKIEACGLNPKYTFESFVVGSSNQLAHAVAKAVAASPGKGYNPFFVYGGVGLGKTHLIQATGHEAVSKHQKLKVLYCTSENFTNNLIEAIQNRAMKEFRAKYRSLDVLIIDDIQFIAGRETTQEEFFHTFNELYAKGKQVILSSDRPPEAISKLEQRLKSRFEGGMIADIQPPDTDLREAILLSKIKRQNISIPAEVVHYLAQNASSSVRDLEGSLIRLVAQAKIGNNSLSLELAKSFFDKRSQGLVKARPKDVLEIICNYFDLRHTDLKSANRLAKFVFPRQIAMYLLRKDLGLQYALIAEVLNKKDHTTVIHGVEKITGVVEKSEKVRGLVEDIRSKLYN